MDRDTLRTHRAPWGEEPQPDPGVEPACLTADERQVCDGLVGDLCGPRVRLEQERPPWVWVSSAGPRPRSGPAGAKSRD